MSIDTNQVVFAVLISEFHDHVGKQIIYQFPEKDLLVNQSDFDNIADYLIPKDELCGRLIVVDFQTKFYVINLAVLLRHDKNQKIYLREKYIFSVALVIEKITYIRNPNLFQVALRKLAFVFTNLENTRHLVYHHQQQGFREIASLLQTSFIELNFSRESVIELDENVFIFVSLNEPSKAQSQTKYSEQDIKYHEVPLPLVKLTNGISTLFDPVAAKILSEILSVGTICEKCVPYTSQQVRQCIANLVQHQLVRMVDIIKTSNCYSISGDIFKSFKDDIQVIAASSYIFVKDFQLVETIEKNKSDAKSMSQIILQVLFSGFRKDITLEEYVIQNKKFMHIINLHRLIRYGQLNNLITRFNEYPLTLKDRTNRYFDQNNYKQYLANWVKPSQRFNEIEQPNVKSKNNIHHLNQHSVAHSNWHQTQIFTNTFNSSPWPFQEQEENKQRVENKITEANNLMNKLVQTSQSLDQICLYFNIDQENFLKIVQTFEVHLINK